MSSTIHQEPGQNVAPAKLNTLAIVSLIMAFFLPLVGVICGHISLSQIKKTGERGRGLALAGTIIGYVAMVLYVIASISMVGALNEGMR